MITPICVSKYHIETQGITGEKEWKGVDVNH
jgi:hypothetical protein